jgi:signal peptidase I
MGVGMAMNVAVASRVSRERTHRREARWGARTGNAIFFLSVAIAALLLAAPMVPRLFGEKVMVVISGSMEPDVPMGAAVIIRPVSPDSVGPGDVITFHPIGVSELESHRIVAIKHVDGVLFYQTKGDANAQTDPNLAPASGLVGRVVTVMPGVGRVMLVGTTGIGRLVLLGIPALLLLFQQGAEILVLWRREPDRLAAERDE